MHCPHDNDAPNAFFELVAMFIELPRTNIATEPKDKRQRLRRTAVMRDPTGVKKPPGF
jgi:hypothetical protein